MKQYKFEAVFLKCSESYLQKLPMKSSVDYNLKGPLPALSQFLTTESPLKDEKYFLFHARSSSCSLGIQIFDYDLFGHIEKRLGKKIYGVIDWKINKYNATYCSISRELKAFRHRKLVSLQNIT